jgi:hypothetical protein
MFDNSIHDQLARIMTYTLIATCRKAALDMPGQFIYPSVDLCLQHQDLIRLDFQEKVPAMPV